MILFPEFVWTYQWHWFGWLWLLRGVSSGRSCKWYNQAMGFRGGKEYALVLLYFPLIAWEKSSELVEIMISIWYLCCIVNLIVKNFLYSRSDTYWSPIQLYICWLPSLWRVLCIWLSGHKSQNMGHQKEGVYPHIQGPHSRSQCHQIYTRWPLGCIWRRGQYCEGLKCFFLINKLK